MISYPLSVGLTVTAALISQSRRMALRTKGSFAISSASTDLAAERKTIILVRCKAMDRNNYICMYL